MPPFLVIGYERQKFGSNWLKFWNILGLEEQAKTITQRFEKRV